VEAPGRWREASAQLGLYQALTNEAGRHTLKPHQKTYMSHDVLAFLMNHAREEKSGLVLPAVMCTAGSFSSEVQQEDFYDFMISDLSYGLGHGCGRARGICPHDPGPDGSFGCKQGFYMGIHGKTRLVRAETRISQGERLINRVAVSWIPAGETT